MHGVNVKCPDCGTLNIGLDLEETDGWMECEHCGFTARLLSSCCEDGIDTGNCRWQVIRTLPGSRSLRALRNHG